MSVEAKNLSLENSLEYLQQLIRFKSITPTDDGALVWLMNHLERLGFACEPFEEQGVKNLIATLYFSPGRTFAFCGHLDVVPVHEPDWDVSPFLGEIRDGILYGRGTADMKGAIAAMLAALETMLAEPEQRRYGTFLWLITTDEEGEAEHGTVKIVEKLLSKQCHINDCLIGEPTCSKFIGDTIKNGRRGSLSGKVTIKGQSGHVAYPENTINAAHLATNITHKLLQLDWTLANNTSKTSFQITNLDVENPCDNIVPRTCIIEFNIRYSHGYHESDIKDKISQCLSDEELLVDINWSRDCRPYYSNFSASGDSSILNYLEGSILLHSGHYPRLSTSGGTSDGRFVAKICDNVIEFGLRNHSIHQANEHIALFELEQLTKIYSSFLAAYFDNTMSIKN